MCDFGKKMTILEKISAIFSKIWKVYTEISRTPDSASRDEKTLARTHNSAKR